MTERGERTDFELIDALSRAVQNYAAALYKKGEVVFSDVTFDVAWEDRDVAWADLEQRLEDLRQARQWQPMDTCPEMTPVHFLRWGEVYVGWLNPYADVTDYPYQIFDADTSDGWNSFHRSSPPNYWAPIVAPAHPPISETVKLRRSAALDELGALDGEELR